MRGEYTGGSYLMIRPMGLPPHAWGIQDIPIYIALVVGITPTCVGNTLQVPSSRHRSEDYPHMRGEYTGGSYLMIRPMGLPPHAWGIQTQTLGMA